MLADLINLPCRIAKGCKYCRRDDASSCLVQIGPDRYIMLTIVDWTFFYTFIFILGNVHASSSG